MGSFGDFEGCLNIGKDWRKFLLNFFQFRSFPGNGKNKI